MPSEGGSQSGFSSVGDLGDWDDGLPHPAEGLRGGQIGVFGQVVLGGPHLTEASIARALGASSRTALARHETRLIRWPPSPSVLRGFR